MCTAITFSKGSLYFGRTLDLERTYGEEVVITPRNFPLPFRHRPDLQHHHAIIGMAHVAQGYPLYYDGVNEAGLCMAGLNFPGFAHYEDAAESRDNVACFEFIPWVLGQFRTVAEVRQQLPQLQLTDTPFSPELPAATLHWIIADAAECIVVESLAEGLRIHENPLGVLTNNPPFDQQTLQLCNFMQLSPEPPKNLAFPEIDLKPYSRGMGAMGLPGDPSSQSRFVRAAFAKCSSFWEKNESVSQFFHIMDTVSQVRGCCRLEDGSCVVTQYTACCDAASGIYYYTTYGNRRICAVDLRREDPEGSTLVRFPLVTGEDIRAMN